MRCCVCSNSVAFLSLYCLCCHWILCFSAHGVGGFMFPPLSRRYSPAWGSAVAAAGSGGGWTFSGCAMGTSSFLPSSVITFPIAASTVSAISFRDVSCLLASWALICSTLCLSASRALSVMCRMLGGLVPRRMVRGGRGAGCGIGGGGSGTWGREYG